MGRFEGIWNHTRFVCPLNDCIYNPEDAKSQRREEIRYLQSRDNQDFN